MSGISRKKKFLSDVVVGRSWVFPECFVFFPGERRRYFVVIFEGGGEKD